MKTELKCTANDPVISSAESNKLRELCNAHQLLADHGHFARAALLAVTAYEEMGKAQLVSDYAQGCASKKEFEYAFRRHDIKTAYMMRQATVGAEVVIAYDKRQAAYQIRLREIALSLYIEYQDGKIGTPSQITKDECDYVFERMLEAFEELEHAEWLNGRTGSKGLFK